jgi:hypothetical protein
MIGARLCVGVEVRNGGGEPTHHVQTELLSRSQAVEQLVFIEAVHLDEPIDRISRPANRQ